MLIADRMFLLLRRDDGRAESATAQNGYGLAAAVITDLILAGRITLTDDKDPRVRVLDDGPTGSAVLDAALLRITERNGKKLSSLVTDRRLALEGLVADSLAEAGVIAIEEKRALGLVPARYPVRDPGPERQVREQLRGVLAGASPQTGDATVLSILHGLGVLDKVLKEERGDLRRKDLKRRIEEVADEDPAGAAVADALRAMNAAMMSAVMVTVVAGGGD